MKDKSKELSYAIVKLEEAIAKLRLVKEALLNARDTQHTPLAIKLIELEEIHGILTDPECRPKS